MRGGFKVDIERKEGKLISTIAVSQAINFTSCLAANRLLHEQAISEYLSK